MHNRRFEVPFVPIYDQQAHKCKRQTGKQANSDIQIEGKICLRSSCIMQKKKWLPLLKKNIVLAVIPHEMICRVCDGQFIFKYGADERNG